MMFHDNTPHATSDTRIIHYLIDEQRTVSITADWVGARALLMKLLESEMHDG